MSSRRLRCRGPVVAAAETMSLCLCLTSHHVTSVSWNSLSLFTWCSLLMSFYWPIDRTARWCCLSDHPYIWTERLQLITHRTRTTVFCRTQNFEPSHGICPFLRNFYVFTEFLWNLVLDGDKGTHTAYFGGVWATVLNVYMISPWNTWLPLGLWREGYWKYWAELMWNIAG